MAIAVNAQTSTNTNTGQSSWSLSHTPAGSDRLLVVFVSLMRSAAGTMSVSSCTFNGTAMTEATTRGWVDSSRSRSYRESIYYMVAPPTGAANVVVTSNVNAMAATIVAISLTGVLQASPLGGTYSADVTSSAVSVTATAQAAGSWMMAAAVMRGGGRTFTPGTNVVELSELSSGSNSTDDVSTVGGYKLVGAAGATTVDWTASSGGYGVIAAAEFKAAGLSIAPAGLAVGAAAGGPTVWSHRLIVPVTVGSDDAYEDSSGSVNISAQYIFVSGGRTVGYIARALGMPATATVVEAHARLYLHSATDVTPKLTLRGQAAPATFAATSNNLSARTKTAASVPWDTTLAVGTRDSPDIRAIVQEIVLSASWIGGNRDVAIFLIDLGGGSMGFGAYESTTEEPTLVIDWRFAGIAPSGLAVGVAIGSPTVGRGAVSVAPAGRAVAVGKGTAVVGRGAVTVAPAGRAMAVGKGTAVVGRGAVTVAPAGRAMAVGKGTAVVGRGAVTVSPAGRAMAVGIGAAALSRRISPAGRAVGVGLGAAVVGRGAVSIAPAGRAVAVGIGAATVSRAAWQIAPAGKGVAVGIGAAVVGRGAVTVSPAGKAVGVAIGAATVARVALRIAPAGRAVAVGIGAATVSVLGPQGIAPAGRAVAVGLGAPVVGLRGIGLYAVSTLLTSESQLEWSLAHAGGGIDRLAVVILHAMRTAAGNITATAEYGGQAMTLVASQVYADEPRSRAYGVFVFALVAPPVGARTVVVGTNVNATAAVVATMTLTNVSQSGPWGAAGGANVVAAVNAAAAVPGTLDGAWLVGGATMRGGDLTFTPGGVGAVEVYDLASGPSSTTDISATGGYRRPLAAGANTWLATANALDYGVAAAVEVRPALDVWPQGLAVAVGVGGARVTVAAIRPAGRAVAVGIGAAVVARPGALVEPAGLAVGVALGATALEIGGVLLEPAGLAVGVGLGAPAVVGGIAPVGLAVGVAIGGASLSWAAVVVPVGLAVGVGIGAARVWSHRLAVAVVEDGYETAGGAVVLGTTSLNVEASSPWVALATGPLPLPAAATIVATRIEMQTIGYDDPALETACERSAAPAALSAALHNISARSLTGQRARWQARDVAHDVGQGTVLSANLGAPVQEVASLPEWTEGASRLMVVLHDLGLGGWLRWYSCDAGASFRPRVIVEWQFGAADLELAPAGLAVAVAAGGAVVVAGGWAIAPAGLAVGLAVGGAVVGRGGLGVAAAGLAIAVATGEPVVSGGLLVIEAEGLAVAVALGDEVLVGWAIRPAGRLVVVAAGMAAVGRGGWVIAPAGRAVGVAAGMAAVGRGGWVIAPAGRAVAVAQGAAVVSRGGWVIAPAGWAVAAAAGTARLGQVARPAGWAVAAVAGAARLGQVARPAGWAVAVAQGVPAVGRGVAMVAPAGRAVAVAVGAATVGRGGLAIAPAGRAVAVASGGATVARRLEIIAPAGLLTRVAFGAALVALARMPWPLTVAARGNELTLDERGSGLTVAARGNELTVEDR